MTDFLLLEEIHRMIKRMPKPRLMFRKGIEARGFFRPYMPLTEYTEAKMFSGIDEITPVSVRFSAMLGDRGTADTVRNIKGMSVKFDTGEGAYDMICHSIPVLPISSDDKFLDMCGAFTKKESFDGINSDRFWRFVVKNSEAVNCAVRLYSGEGLTDSYIDAKWSSVNLAIWKNVKGERFLVRCAWKPVHDEKRYESGHKKKIDRIYAEFMAGFDGNRAAEQLEASIRAGRFPSYELYIQMTDYERAKDTELTRMTLLWDEDEIPPIAAGVMKLTDMPEDDIGMRDLTCFAPGNTVKGIELYRDGLSNIIDYICRVQADERGEHY